jgi:RNA 3'-terminal phosphate cyclase (ATP)
MDEMVEIDGSLYEGGGQMIRSSLALSLLLNREFRMVGIRKNRPNPGINNQLRSIFSAFVEKVPKLGDSEVYFYPKFLQPKEILAPTAASCTLMMQCLVPVLNGLGCQQEVKINGGTDVSRSPPLESIRLGLIPLLAKMGIHLEIVDVKPGYYPVGKGYVVIRLNKCEAIQPIRMTELGKPEKVVITYYVKDTKPPGSSKDFRKEVKRILAHAFGEDCKIEYEVKHQKVFNTKDEYGIGCIVTGENLVWDVGTVGEKVKEADILERLEHYAEKKVCLDEHHQDQLLLNMGLAHGTSELLVGEELSLHTQSLIYILQKFIPELEVTH